MNEQKKTMQTKSRTSKKYYRRMNLVDWLLIIVAVVSVGVFVYFAFFSELSLFGSSEEKISVEYTVKIENVNAQLLGISATEKSGTLNCDFIDVKDKVYDCASGKSIGRVVSVKYEQTTRPTGKVDENGHLIYARYPGYVDIIITVSGTGKGNDGVYSIDDYEIRVGSDVEIRTEGYNALGKCISVSGKETQNDDN